MNKNLKIALLIIGGTIFAAAFISLIIGFINFNVKLFLVGGILLFFGGLALAFAQSSLRVKETFDDEIETLKQTLNFDKETKNKISEEIEPNAKCKNCGAKLTNSVCDYCGAVNKKEHKENK